jgi:hypothetical protein
MTRPSSGVPRNKYVLKHFEIKYVSTDTATVQKCNDSEVLQFLGTFIPADCLLKFLSVHVHETAWELQNRFS